MLRRLHIILERAGCKQIRFHDLRHTFATMALENGMDIKTLSAMLGHVSAATTLDIYTHITDDMQRTAAANIDRGIGKAAPQENASEPGQETAPAQAEKPSMTDFKPYVGRRQKALPQCLRPYPRGVRGKTERADRGDESGNCGSAAAERHGRRRWAAAEGEEM